MRFDPDFPPASQQVAPVDRAVTLLMPPGFLADQFGSELAATAGPAADSITRRPGRGPGWRARLVGFLLRPN